MEFVSRIISNLAFLLSFFFFWGLQRAICATSAIQNYCNDSNFQPLHLYPYNIAFTPEELH